MAQSRHELVTSPFCVAIVRFAVAIGGKADTRWCTAHVRL
jgi:hypothetical protein